MYQFVVKHIQPFNLMGRHIGRPLQVATYKQYPPRRGRPMCLPVGLNYQYIINHDKKYLNLINDEILIHQQTFTAILINGTTHRSDNPLEVKN